MKKRLMLILLVLLPCLVFSQNESSNQTSPNQTISGNETIWYENYWNKATQADTLTLVSIIVGLILVYFLGKFAFKLIKWTIIILAIILAITIIF